MQRLLISLLRISPVVLLLVLLGGQPGSALAGVPVDSTAFSIPIVLAEHGLWSYAVSIGVAPSATSGIDAGLGEVEYPPLPPGGGTMLLGTKAGNTILDLRQFVSSAQSDTYRVVIALDASDTNLFPMVFSWPNLSTYYSGSVHLKADAGGSAFDIDMKAQTSYSLAAYPFTPPVASFSVYIYAEGPLQGPKLPIISTYAEANGGLQAIVHAPAGVVASPRAGMAVTGTSAWFEYGPTLTYGNTTPPHSVSGGTSTTIFDAFDPGSLPPNSRLHFRSVAQNSLGTFYGGDRIFSNGTPPPEVEADTTKYRTATYRDWADAKDQKGKRLPVKGKADKVDFIFNVRAAVIPLTNNPDTLLNLKFNVPIETLTVTGGKIVQFPICYHMTWNDKKHQTASFNFGCQAGLLAGDTIQFTGRGLKGKPVTIAYKWVRPDKSVIFSGTLPNTNAPAGDTLKLNILRYPMPNLQNVGLDIYGGTMQTAVDITVGTNADPKGAHTVYHPKFKDVVKSLVKGKKDADLYHTAPPRPINTFDKKGDPISKKQKSLPPDKHNNSLFGQQLALKLNIAASDSGDFPQGLGDLIYDNSPVKLFTGPFDGLTIRAIADSVDKYLGDNGEVAGTDDSTEFFKVDSLINAAFAGPFDTVSWGNRKVVTTGVRTVGDVPYLHSPPENTPRVYLGHGPATTYIRVPETFQLKQNYPNPFNPQTTIEFTLPEASIVTLKIYNVLGQEVAKLLNGETMDNGSQEVEFNAANLPSGVYFYRLEAQSILDEETGTLGEMRTSVKKMLLVR
jgi:hypothetical protein